MRGRIGINIATDSAWNGRGRRGARYRCWRFLPASKKVSNLPEPKDGGRIDVVPGALSPLPQRPAFDTEAPPALSRGLFLVFFAKTRGQSENLPQNGRKSDQ